MTESKTIKQTFIVENQQTVALNKIPVLGYDDFFKLAADLLSSESTHCLGYYAFVNGKTLKFICAIANDAQKNIELLSHELKDKSIDLKSLAAVHLSMHIFEREISENWGIHFLDHPWPKPVRYPFDRNDNTATINSYPFYKIESNELHEVGVGPIHAGVIEPGHFRFQCNGETVLHLEIQLGWQHRGVESLFLTKKKLIQRTVLAESIAGDTAIGHNLAFCHLLESLGGLEVSNELNFQRAIGLELERIAVHVGDLSAMCTDVAYQLGNAAYGALRTPVINFTQTWCGNRFGKGLIRVGGAHYALTNELIQKLKILLDDFETRFLEISDRTFNLPSVLKRFEGIGGVSKKQILMIGGVGMVARMAGVKRDTRWSHPFGGYKNLGLEPVIENKGDVLARGLVRRREVVQSISIIRLLMDKLDLNVTLAAPLKANDLKLAPNSLAISVTEGWRGEICHMAVTDAKGELLHYKVKDPSMHNWKSLELSLRDLEISDFPINNKSYDLSYCGHDL